MRQWQCPWCGATRSQEFSACPDSCGWTQTAHPAALAAIAVGDDHFAATGSNPARALESLGMALRAAGREGSAAAGATVIDAPDVGPWSFHGRHGPYVDVSRPGADVVDVVDMWDNFEYDWVGIDETTEFLRLCRRWLIDWAERFERMGD